MALLTTPPEDKYDVLVLGSGMAGIASALAAHDAGAKVLVIEKAPRESAGGSTRLSGGGFRVPKEDYSPDDFYADLMLVTKGQGNKTLLRHMADNAADAINWLKGHGLKFGDPKKFRPDLAARRLQIYMHEPVPFEIEGSHQIGSGNGVVQYMHKGLFEKVDVVCDTKAVELLVDEHRRITGVRTFHNEHGFRNLTAGAVVLATGGFQANQEMRARYFGRGSVHWRIRGTRYNTGDGINMASAVGANLVGEFGDIHCAVIDARSRAVECGETNLNTYPFGILVNANGERFLDEGEDFRDRTYAKFGKNILAQPGSVAHLIFDSTMLKEIAGLIENWGPVSAPTLEELAKKLDINAKGLAKTVADFNAAIDTSVPFNNKQLDGRRAVGIEPPKSNWAVEVSKPPFYAYSVTGGVTFTFGGVNINVETEVLDSEGYAIPGLYAAGEIMGDFFYHNYPSGSSLVRASVYGRTAGRNAAQHASQKAKAA